LSRLLTAIALATCAAPLAGCGETTHHAPDDNVIYAVPADARAYVHLDRSSGDWKRARESLARLPAIETALLDLISRAPHPPGNGEAGIALLPGSDKPRVVEPGARPAKPSLGGLPGYQQLIEGLPARRFAHAYVSQGALGPLRRLDRSVTAVAAAADLDGDVMRIRLRAAHRRVVGPCSAGRGTSALLDIADPDAAFYAEVPSITCAIRALAARFDGVGAALGAFGRAAERRGGVSLEDELLPLLKSRGALIATPGKHAPTLTLIVDGVDETEALDILARLQPALIHLLGVGELGQAPTFGSTDVEGITAATARLAPGLELSYAAWDDRLVVSTSLDGIAAVRRAKGLPGSESFDAVLGDRPSEPSALVFLDLNQLLALGEQAGLAEDPRYLAVRDDLQKLRAAGAVLSREEKFTTAELTFQIP
jgi:hypothetical protein